MREYKTGGGHVKFYPYKKVGMEKVLAMLKGGGGHKKIWGRFYAVALAILKGGCKKFPHFKRGGGAHKVLPCLPVNNDQSLKCAIFPCIAL